MNGAQLKKFDEIEVEQQNICACKCCTHKHVGTNWLLVSENKRKRIEEKLEVEKPKDKESLEILGTYFLLRISPTIHNKPNQVTSGLLRKVHVSILLNL